VCTFHGAKLLDSLKKHLTDYLLRSKNSLYETPESVQVSLSRFTCQELQVTEVLGFMLRKFKEIVTRLKRY